MAQLQQAVGENLRRIRKLQKMSLEQTAQEAGVSKSMLGQIERGEANPSVAILGRLADALKVPVAQLLECRDNRGTELSLMLERKPVRLDGGKVVRRPVFLFDSHSRMESCHVDIFISGRFAPEPQPPGCTAFLTVLSGSAKITVSGETHVLTEWDGIRFPADQPYQVENQSSSTVRLYLIYQYAPV